MLVGSLRTGSGRSWKVQAMEVVWETSFRGSFSAGREEKEEGDTLGRGCSARVYPRYIECISNVYSVRVSGRGCSLAMELGSGRVF